MDINTKEEKTKYQTELNDLIRKFQTLEQQRNELIQAIHERQGIQQNNRELLADIGVLSRKDTGSGYMMKIQPMVRLLAGGIYQTRARIDELVDVIVAEFPQVANRLMAKGLLSKN